jgi:hypothetical protein
MINKNHLLEERGILKEHVESLFIALSDIYKNDTTIYNEPYVDIFIKFYQDRLEQGIVLLEQGLSLKYNKYLQQLINELNRML